MFASLQNNGPVENLAQGVWTILTTVQYASPLAVVAAFVLVCVGGSLYQTWVAPRTYYR